MGNTRAIQLIERLPEDYEVLGGVVMPAFQAQHGVDGFGRPECVKNVLNDAHAVFTDSAAHIRSISP